jgi:catechol 2,3-dioxygenase-like lactoylglutathione lyase family enzyme
MLNGKPVHTTLPASDLARSKAFYSEKLGFEPTEESPGGNMYETGGGTFILFPGSTPSAGASTQMGFMVDDIEAEVAELKARGVAFESYGDMPNFDAETSIASPGPVKAAWFKDSEGNLLGLVQFMT